MNKLIKSELYKLTHDIVILILIPISVLAYIFVIRIRGVANLNDPAFVIRMLANPFAVMWISVILGTYFFGYDFSARSLNGAVYYGHGRLKIIGSKLICYYSLAFVIILLSLAIAIQITVPDVYSRLSVNGYLGRILVYLVLSFGTISFPMLLAVCFQDMFKSIGSAAIFTYLMQQLMGRAAEGTSLDKLLLYYPPYLQIDFNLWRFEQTDTIFRAMAVSIGWMLISAIISVIVIKYRELK